MARENPSNPIEIDLDKNSADLQIPKDIYVRILVKAFPQTQQDIQDLEAALPAGDFEKVQSVSHRLKGDYDNMRISALSSVAKKINESVKEGKGKAAIEPLLGQLKNNFTQVRQFVEKPKGT